MNFKKLLIISTFSLLYACGGSEDENITEDVTENNSDNPAVCEAANLGSSVNWDALLEADCQNLSDYNLFSDPNDPTSGANETGIPYDLSTALFTDYATKYRFVFVPPSTQATFSEHEVIEFPVGTVLVKTFALPENTNSRGENETLIETRLLIHRESGWKARPYYWETSTNAKYIVSGKTIESSLVHNGEELSFNYVVPQGNQCTSCHSITPMLQDNTDKRKSIFKPIGPKARYLNHDYDYTDSTQNQLTYWKDQGILTNLPADSASIETAAIFDDNVDINALNSDELNLAARSYLDINCAHCHRSELTIPEADYEGPAGDSGLQVEFNRDFDLDPRKFGVCKSAVASGHPDYPRDIIPGYSEKSYIPYRMSVLSGSHKMPELGRSTKHSEGVALIKLWINDMSPDDCDLSL